VKRVIGLVFICGAASCVAVTAAPTAAPHETAPALAPGKKTAIPTPSASDLAKRAADKEAARRAAVLQLAPADEYFGPLKLSIIGMRNTIRDLGLRYDVNHDISKQTFASAQLVERSVREWQRKYARDDQLPRVVFVLQRLYTKVLTQESRDRAHATAQWLLGEFGRSPQARQLTKTLAYEHLAPLPPPTPEPEATYQSIFGRGYPSEFAPSPTATPARGAGLRRRASPAPPPPAAGPSIAPASPNPTPLPTGQGGPPAPAGTPTATPAGPSPRPANPPRSPASTAAPVPAPTATPSPAPAATATAAPRP